MCPAYIYQCTYLPPVGVVLVTDLQNVSLLKPESKRLARNLVVRLGRIVEVRSDIFLEAREREKEKELTDHMYIFYKVVV